MNNQAWLTWGVALTALAVAVASYRNTIKLGEGIESLSTSGRTEMGKLATHEDLLSQAQRTAGIEAQIAALNEQVLCSSLPWTDAIKHPVPFAHHGIYLCLLTNNACGRHRNPYYQFGEDP